MRRFRWSLLFVVLIANAAVARRDDQLSMRRAARKGMVSAAPLDPSR